MTNAAIGKGTRIEIHDGSGDMSTGWVRIHEGFNLDPPNDTSDLIDATNFDSTAKEYIFGFDDFEEMTFQMNFLPGSDSEEAILAARAARAPRGVRLTFPSGYEWSFMGLVRGYKPAVPAADKMTATVTIKPTGGMTRAQPGSGS